jgi:hypothetical protein
LIRSSATPEIVRKLINAGWGIDEIPKAILELVTTVDRNGKRKDKTGV